jgi:hypothetical protein
VPASELRDRRVPLGALWPQRRAREFAEQLSCSADDEDRAAAFQRMVRVRAGPPCLADLAVAAGYADQPHLSREVRSLMGTTAAELVRRSPRCPIGSRRASMLGDSMEG